jgi:hypothetical protein
MNTVRHRLRITSTDSEVARVSVRRHQTTVGRPIDFDEAYPYVTALEQALGALGAEIVTGLRVFAKRRRVDIDRIEAVVDGELENPLTYLEVVGEAGHPRLSKIAIKVFVASPCDEDVVNKLWNETRGLLPLVQAFGRALSLQIELLLEPGFGSEPT